MTKKQPTKKEKELVKNLVANGGNKTRAALKAYDTKKPKRAYSIASKALKKPEVQGALQEELRRQKITLGRALKPISKALVATKKDADGTTVDDLDIQLKGSDRALKLLLPDRKGDNNLSISLNIDSANFGGEFVIDAKEAIEYQDN